MRREIALLRRELEMQDVISGKDEMGQNHRPLNEAQKLEIARWVALSWAGRIPWLC